jgi:hypothetical protein
MALNRIHLLALPLAAASVALTACSGGDDSTAAGGGDRTQFREAALEFAECMRKQGVDMPDPQPGGGLVLRAGPETGNDPETVERAQEACRKHLEDVRPPELSEEDQREFREQALKHARCMREHGIDIPDPTFGDGNRVQQRLPEGIEPGDPRLREAQEACSRYREALRAGRGEG